MATPKRKYPYNFIYADGKHMEFELTTEDFAKIIDYKCKGTSIVPVSIGFLDISDVIVAVRKKEPEQMEEKSKKVKEKNDSFSTLFNLPYLDPDSEEYLRKSLAELWEGEQ